LIVLVTFAQLQVFSNSEIYTTKEKYAVSGFRIIPAKRGQIYIRDLSASPTSNRYNVPVTSTQTQSTISFDPNYLKKSIDLGLKIEEVARYIAGYFNLNYQTIYNKIKLETGKEKPPQYSKLISTNGNNLKDIEFYLYSNPKTMTMAKRLGLKVEEQEIRYYPHNDLLASTIGFVRKSKGPRVDALKANCTQTVLENEKRNTVDTYISGDFSKGEYTIGNYGLEQEFCDALSGLNGRRALNSELNKNLTSQLDVQNGADIYLTIDKNLQKKAENTCATYFKLSTNENGSPDDCGAIIMNSKTGEILAMASYPSFDLNRYGTTNTKYYQNVLTNIDYDVGSIMKPLTVAMALNENYLGNKNSQGELSGIDRNYLFQDYDSKGKPYQENNGIIHRITNAESKSYANLGKIPIETCLRLSINTCSAAIADTLNNLVKQDYLINKYKFGKSTDLRLPGQTNGITQNFVGNVRCQYCYAQMSFGQGFTTTMVQFMRAFSSIANGTGKIVEPTIYSSISYSDQKIITPKTPDTKITQTISKEQVVEPKIAELTRNLMIKSVDESTPGKGLGNTIIPGYEIFAKSGTGEIATRDCNYSCHSRKGLYNHSCIGGVKNDQTPIVVLIKMGKPFPGQVSGNFAGNYLCKAMSDLMLYTFDYLNIPKTRNV
jgi:cell division protein FtsI/penicillin-binding protein 2